jgi:hypothetical protein
LKTPKEELCKTRFHYRYGSGIDAKFLNGRKCAGSTGGEIEPWSWPFPNSALANAATFGRFRGTCALFEDRSVRCYTNYYNICTDKSFSDSQSTLVNSTITKGAPSREALIGTINRSADGIYIRIPMLVLAEIEDREEREKAMDEIIILLLAFVNQRRNIVNRQAVVSYRDGRGTRMFRLQ